ncbi:MAG: exodeoxyribonuclease VII large subunit [Thermodesulfobacteriota bacterium]
MEIPQPKVFTVSELTSEIKTLLEKRFPSVWVQGEISNFRPAASGHLYFTLKDESSQIRAVMFKTQSRFLRFRPEDGLQVIGWGRVSVYSPRGEYQLMLDTMEPRGFGSLMVAFEQLKEKLAAEGLFDQSRKRELPRFPGTVGLVTSTRGAAVRDMIRIIGRRWAGTSVVISATIVQGEQAPASIVAALERLAQVAGVDVIIVGRGGGSMEDLWAFNDERVVRAVAGCPIPIVSAVGHETDFTLTDFAADVRASTPSAAAELAVPDWRDLHAAVGQLATRMRVSMGNLIERRTSDVHQTVRRLRDPRALVNQWRQLLDDLTVRLANSMRGRISRLQQEREATVRRLRPEHLTRLVIAKTELTSALSDRLKRAMAERLNQARHTIEHVSARLDAISPRGVLNRGYALVVRPDTGRPVRNSRDVEIGEELAVHLSRGALDCRVAGRRHEDETSAQSSTRIHGSGPAKD